MLRSQKNALKHLISKTMPDEAMNSQIRVSLGDDAKQRLRQISKISVFSLESRSRDWGRKQTEESLKITTFGQKDQLQKIGKNQLRRKDKNRKIETNKYHHLFKTLSSLRQDRASAKKSCKSIQLQFQNDQKQPQERIHSKRSNPINLYNSTFYITQRLLNPKMKTNNQKIEIQIPNKRNEYRKFKEKKHFKNSHLVSFKTNDRFNGLQKQSRTQTTLITQANQQKKAEKSHIPSKTAYFINAILRQEHRSVFCPTKYLLTKKKKEGLTSFN